MKYTINTYFHEGEQKFDDSSKDVFAEPFSWGVDELIPQELLEVSLNIAFSDKPMGNPKTPETFELNALYLREEEDGYIYKETQVEVEFLLCRVLDKYFSTPPKQLYFQASSSLKNKDH